MCCILKVTELFSPTDKGQLVQVLIMMFICFLSLHAMETFKSFQKSSDVI